MKKEINVPAILEQLEKVTNFVNQELKVDQLPEKVIRQFDIAIDELFTNIASYAYEKGQEGAVTVQLEKEDSPPAIQISFIDSGIPFDPLSHEEPDVSLGVEERSIGGLGIFLVKKIMDDVQYRFENGKNIITIKKYFDGGIR